MNFMEEALKIARKSLDSGEVPVGCVFVKENQIIAEGHNTTNKSKNGTKHSEIVAVESALSLNPFQSFEGSTLYVTCEPCIMCAEFLSLLKVSQVFFGCRNPKFGGNGSILSLHSG
jgi:tRNA-specific adenosine deaminase 2